MKVFKGLSVVLMILFLTGCRMTYDYPTNYNNYTAKSQVGGSYGVDMSYESYETGQQVSYDGYVSVETKKFDNDSKAILEELKRVGGIIQSQSNQLNENYATKYVGTSSYLTLKIPANKFQDFINYLKDNYELQNININSLDITKDIDETAEELALLKSRLAEVEEKLSETKLTFTQKEDLEQQKRDLEDQIKQIEDEQQTQTTSVEYSTLTLNIISVDYFTREGLPFWIPFTMAFSQFFTYIAEGIVFSITASIAAIPFLFIGGLTYLNIRKQQFLMLNKLKQKIEAEDNPKNTNEPSDNKE